MRHLGISRATLYRYRKEGLGVTKHRQDGRLVAFVKRVEAQTHFRQQRHAAKDARFQA
jgi:predicted site-specific integrase-resolvase